jgi:hypothetical protein
VKLDVEKLFCKPPTPPPELDTADADAVEDVMGDGIEGNGGCASEMCKAKRKKPQRAPKESPRVVSYTIGLFYRVI